MKEIEKMREELERSRKKGFSEDFNAIYWDEKLRALGFTSK